MSVSPGVSERRYVAFAFFRPALEAAVDQLFDEVGVVGVDRVRLLMAVLGALADTVEAEIVE